MLIRISATNRGPEPARLHLLPTIWFRNTWSWTKEAIKPRLAKGSNGRPGTVINIDHPVYGRRYLYLENKPAVLFTENETNSRRLYDAPGPVFCKDGINDFVVNGRIDAVNPDSEGTKAAPRLSFHGRARRDRDRQATADRPGMAGGERSVRTASSTACF